MEVTTKTWRLLGVVILCIICATIFGILAYLNNTNTTSDADGTLCCTQCAVNPGDTSNISLITTYSICGLVIIIFIVAYLKHENGRKKADTLSTSNNDRYFGKHPLLWKMALTLFIVEILAIVVTSISNNAPATPNVVTITPIVNKPVTVSSKRAGTATGLNDVSIYYYKCGLNSDGTCTSTTSFANATAAFACGYTVCKPDANADCCNSACGTTICPMWYYSCDGITSCRETYDTPTIAVAKGFTVCPGEGGAAPGTSNCCTSVHTPVGCNIKTSVCPTGVVCNKCANGKAYATYAYVCLAVALFFMFVEYVTTKQKHKYAERPAEIGCDLASLKQWEAHKDHLSPLDAGRLASEYRLCMNNDNSFTKDKFGTSITSEQIAAMHHKIEMLEKIAHGSGPAGGDAELRTRLAEGRDVAGLAGTRLEIHRELPRDVDLDEDGIESKISSLRDARKKKEIYRRKKRIARALYPEEDAERRVNANRDLLKAEHTVDDAIANAHAIAAKYCVINPGSKRPTNSRMLGLVNSKEQNLWDTNTLRYRAWLTLKGPDLPETDIMIASDCHEEQDNHNGQTMVQAATEAATAIRTAKQRYATAVAVAAGRGGGRGDDDDDDDDGDGDGGGDDDAAAGGGGGSGGGLGVGQVDEGTIFEEMIRRHLKVKDDPSYQSLKRYYVDGKNKKQLLDIAKRYKLTEIDK